MQNNEKATMSLAQLIFLLAISVLFIGLIWRMFTLEPLMKVCLFCFFGIFVFVPIVYFPESLGYVIKSSSKWLILFITAIVFLLIPLTSNIVYDLHKRAYLESLPANEEITFEITYKIEHLNSSGNIGDELTHLHFFNDQSFKNRDILTINANTPFSIRSQIIEHDGISDIGETISDNYIYSQNSNYKKPLIISQKVRVYECGGRRNGGATANFSVTYTLERVIPLSVTFWKLLLYTESHTEYAFGVLLICGQIINIFFIVFVFVRGKKQKKIIEKREQEQRVIEQEQERFQAEKKIAEEKEIFLKRLNGQSLRQAAGVPLNISFVNSLPKDNNDATYGSFTVYCSKNGSCYHDKPGCCSAHFSMHYFNAKNQYRPCSKCCTTHREIPQWYKEYSLLKKQARKFRIDVE
ncbi:MAG: hypothetical protein E7319_05195 [Clostridiales bacterium]|nr:hypothetical protein [Clostridiales bacterium]